MSFEKPGPVEFFLTEYIGRWAALPFYRRFTGSITLEGNETILDLGCGNGTISEMLAGRLDSGKLVCLDTSGFWLNIARKRMRRFKDTVFISKDITRASIKNSSIDIAVIHFMLHDLSRIDRLSSLKKLHSLLKENGKIYIREPTKMTHGMRPDEIKIVFEKAGFCQEGEFSYGRFLSMEFCSAIFMR